MLQKALSMSMDTDEAEVNLEAMTEEEQVWLEISLNLTRSKLFISRASLVKPQFWSIYLMIVINILKNIN
jgi:hypothetical protein